MAEAVHQVLAVACKAAGVDAGAYARGPKPELHGPSYVALAKWIADRARELVPAKHRREHDELVAWARRVLDREKISKPEHMALRARFPVVRHGLASGREVNTAGPIVCAEGAALEALVCLDRDVSGRGAKPAAAHAAKALGAAFVDALAAEILRLELLTLIDKSALDVGDAVVEASLWRGATGAKATHFIAKLAGGDHALVAKTKGKWTWTRGSRDDVLASVPDALMESAVQAVVGGKVVQPKTSVRGAIARIDDQGVLAGVALAGGRAWFAFEDGRVGVWDEELRISGATIGRIDGIAARGTAVVTWGERAMRWDDLVAVAIERESVDLPPSEPIPALAVDKGEIDFVVRCGSHVVARHADKKRVTVFDERGRPVHQLRARDLGKKGAAVDALFPLKGGDVLAFSPFPRGEIFLVAWDGTLLAEWKLDRFYVPGKSVLCDEGDDVLFGHSRDRSRLLRIQRGSS